MTADIEAMIDAEFARTMHRATEDGQFIAVPNDYSVQDLEDLLPKPRRARASAKLRDLTSLSEYLTRFGTADTVAFARFDAKEIVAEIDYHGSTASGGAPSHRSHLARFCAKRSHAWAAWSGANNAQKGQADFARFLEERAEDVVSPDAATVIETAMNLEAIKKVTFNSSIRLSDGLRQFKYHEEDQTNGEVKVPETFLINVPIFTGMAAERVAVRLRYRISEGKLVLWTTIDNLTEIEDIAFDACVGVLQREHPDLPIYNHL